MAESSPDQMAPGVDADRPANGGGRVRRCCAGDHPRISRPVRSARRAARRLRRLARRQQRVLHQGGGQAVRTGGQSVSQVGRRHSIAAAAVHRLLAVESLPRRRGLCAGEGLPERSGERPPDDRVRRIPGGLHRHRLHVRARTATSSRKGEGRARSAVWCGGSRARRPRSSS